MNFASRITRTPHVFDPDRGRDALEQVPGLEGDLKSLVEGVGGCSPFLSGLLGKEGHWVEAAFDGPEAALTREFDRLRSVAQDEVEGTLADELRRAKRRVALTTASWSPGGLSSLASQL